MLIKKTFKTEKQKKIEKTKQNKIIQALWTTTKVKHINMEIPEKEEREKGQAYLNQE